MKLLTVISFLLLAICSPCVGQDVDSLRSHLNRRLADIDSLIANHLDSTKTIAKDDLTGSIITRISSVKDSLQKINAINSFPQRLTVTVKKIEGKPDSLIRQKLRTSRINATDSLQGAMKDSLGRIIQIPNHIITKSSMVLAGKFDSLNNKNPAMTLATHNNEITTKANAKVNEVQGKLNDKLEIINKNPDGAINLKLNNNLKLPAQSSMGAIPSANEKLSLPTNFKVPSIGTESNIGRDLKLPSMKLDSKLEGLHMPELNASKINGLENNLKLPEVEDKLDLANQISSDPESKLNELGPGDILQTPAGNVETYKAMVDKWNSDPEYQKEMMITAAKERAENYFAGHEQQLQSALSTVSKMKEKVKESEGILDITRKHQQNAMKDKPLRERIIPGVTIQFQKNYFLLMDINPVINYRLTGRVTLGAGWNERLNYNNHTQRTNNYYRIFGPRALVSLKIAGNLSVKAEVESMNCYDRKSLMSANMPENKERQWHWSYFAGAKKDFQYSKTWWGNIQLLYNIYDRFNKSPYNSKFNVRIGFEHLLTKNRGSQQ